MGRIHGARAVNREPKRPELHRINVDATPSDCPTLAPCAILHSTKGSTGAYRRPRTHLKNTPLCPCRRPCRIGREILGEHGRNGWDFRENLKISLGGYWVTSKRSNTKSSREATNIRHFCYECDKIVMNRFVICSFNVRVLGSRFVIRVFVCSITVLKQIHARISWLRFFSGVLRVLVAFLQRC